MNFFFSIYVFYFICILVLPVYFSNFRGSKNKGSMDPVYILMDPVYGSDPRTRGPCFLLSRPPAVCKLQHAYFTGNNGKLTRLTENACSADTIIYSSSIKSLDIFLFSYSLPSLAASALRRSFRQVQSFLHSTYWLCPQSKHDSTQFLTEPPIPDSTMDGMSVAPRP